MPAVVHLTAVIHIDPRIVLHEGRLDPARGPGVAQQLRRFGMTGLAGHIESRPAVGILARDSRARYQQFLQVVRTAHPGGVVEGGVAGLILGIDVVRRFQQSSQHRRAFPFRRQHQRRHCEVVGVRRLCVCGNQMTDHGLRSGADGIFQGRTPELVGRIDASRLRERIRRRLIRLADRPKQQFTRHLRVTVRIVRGRQRQRVRRQQFPGPRMSFAGRASQPPLGLGSLLRSPVSQ